MSIWPRNRNVYANALCILEKLQMEVCSPSELRFEYFQKRKELSEVSSKSSPDHLETFSSRVMSLYPNCDTPGAGSEKDKGTSREDLEPKKPEHLSFLRLGDSSLLARRRQNSFKIPKASSENIIQDPFTPKVSIVSSFSCMQIVEEELD